MLRYFTSESPMARRWSRFSTRVARWLAVDQGIWDRELWRRQQGYGRGGRMKIEPIPLTFSPVCVMVNDRLPDRDHAPESRLAELEGIAAGGNGVIPKAQARSFAAPGTRRSRGALKYDFPEARYVLERASAAGVRRPRGHWRIGQTVLRELGIEFLAT